MWYHYDEPPPIAAAPVVPPQLAKLEALAGPHGGGHVRPRQPVRRGVHVDA